MQVVGFPVILQGNVSFQGTVADAGIFPFTLLVELVVDDLLTVEVHLEVVALAGNDHLVPFSRLLGHVLGWPDRADNAAMIVVAHLLVGFAVRVQNLALNAGLYRILGVADAEIYTAVSAFGILVFDLEDEVLVFFTEVR